MWVQHIARNLPEQNKADNVDNDQESFQNASILQNADRDRRDCIVPAVVSKLSLEPDNSDNPGQRTRES
jgi:hypothetical protein